MAGTPANVSAEMISTSTIRVSWSPPTDGDTVTGYILRYTDRDGEKIDTRLPPNEHSYIIDHCGENVNTSIIALSAHLASIPEEIELLLRKRFNHVFKYVLLYATPGHCSGTLQPEDSGL